LKENVIVGRLIPAGSGLAHHQERRRKRQRPQVETPFMDEAPVAETAADPAKADERVIDNEALPDEEGVSDAEQTQEQEQDV
ncbi:MAG: hypothetical protein WD138_00205, partial [Halofilum sp. (in: g-proteobacteria)]